MTEQFRDSMAQWILIKNQLASVRQDVKILNTQEKSLRTFIQGYMREQQINACNVTEHKAKVSYNVRTSRGSFNKNVVRAGLLKYFRGDETLVDRVFELIHDEMVVTERDTISIKKM
jgi:Family of unknown function (DUF5760)